MREIAEILTSKQEHFQRAAEAIQAGKLVAFATETVYGLGADAFNDQAVARVFEAKERPAFDPLIVHVASTDQAKTLVTRWPLIAQQLADTFWPGPMTLVLPKQESISDLVTAGLPNVAIRWPAHPVAQALIEYAKTPIAAPSANRFTHISPTTAEHVASDQQLAAKIRYILDGGACACGLESTVISLVQDQPAVLRLGSLTVEAIEQVVGAVQLQTQHISEKQVQAGLASPGTHERHYAPRTPMQWLAPGEIPNASSAIRTGLIGMQLSESQCHAVTQAIDLSPEGDLVQAAANLFASLRMLDQAELDQLYACPVPEQGLGRAINDRLCRACKR